MEFFSIVVIAVLIFFVVKQSNELSAYKKELDIIHQRLRTLYGRTEYNYSRIKQLSGDTEQVRTDNQTAPTQNTCQADNPVVTQADEVKANNAPAKNTAYNPYMPYKTGNAPAYDSSPIFRDIPKTYGVVNTAAVEHAGNAASAELPVTQRPAQQTMTQNTQPGNTTDVQQTGNAPAYDSSPIFRDIPKTYGVVNTAAVEYTCNAASAELPVTQRPAQQTMTQNTQPGNTTDVQQTGNAPHSNNVPDVRKQSAPVAPINTVNFKQPEKKIRFDGESIKSFENWLGTRVFNVIASLLVFIGLILFGTLAYDKLSDFIKVAAMFIISGGIIALGSVLSKKNRSIFSLGLTGCGFGALFITILLSHVYFHIMSDIAAFAMLLVWGIFAVVMSKIFESTMLSITAHLGMSVSVCCAFGLGFSADKIVLLVVYQIASILVIVLGNIFFSRKTYRFGLFVSMGLFVYSTAVMLSAFAKAELYLLGLSNTTFISLFAVQTIGISFISYLLAVSATKLCPDSDDKRLLKIQLGIHIANKLLWALGVYLSVGFSLSLLITSDGSNGSDIPATLSLLAVAAAHLAVTVLITEKLNFSERLSTVSCWVCSSLIVLCLTAFSELRTVLEGMPFLFVYALALILITKYTKTKQLNHLISAVLVSDMVITLCNGYSDYIRHGSVAVAVLYALAVGAAVLYHWFTQSGESRQKRFMLFKITEYLWFSLSSIVILYCALDKYIFTSILIALSIINILAYLTNYSGTKLSLLKITVTVETALTLYMGYFMISFGFPSEGTATEITLRIALTVLCGILLTLASIDCIKSKSTVLQLLSGISVSFYITALSSGLSGILYVAEIYSDILGSRPFFFVLAVTWLIMYKVTKNKKLEIFTFISLMIDMFLMTVVGYRSLTDNGLTILCVAYFAVTCALMFCLWYLKPEEEREKYLLPLKAAEYLWFSLSSIVILNCALDKYAFTSILIALSIINILAYLTNYSGTKLNLLKITVTVETALTLYSSYFEISRSFPSEGTATEITLRIALTVLCGILLTLASIDCIKSKSTVLQILSGISVSFYVTALSSGLSGILYVAEIYSDILGSRPFFFVLAVTWLIMYKVTKNKTLEIFTFISLMIDMFLMTVAGYRSLTENGLTILCVAYFAVTCALMFCLWYLKPEEEREKYLLPLKAAEYLWFYISVPIICLTSLDGSGISRAVTLIILLSANVASHILKYFKAERNYLSVAAKIVSIVTMFIGFFEISNYIPLSAENYALKLAVKMVLIMVSAAVYMCYVYGYIKSDSVLRQIFSGLTLTILVLTSCHGVSYITSIAYIFSSICMITALVCVIIGFATKAKGLRLYGLFVIMLSVLKLVTVDISSSDSMARVGAFIAGGVVCFIISGIYNRVEKIYAAKYADNEPLETEAVEITNNSFTDKNE